MTRRTLFLLAALLAGCGSSSGSGDEGWGATDDGGGGDVAAVPGEGGAPSGDAGPSDAPATTSDGGDAGVPSGPAAATIRFHYPAGSHTLSLRGSIAPYDWTTGVALTAGPSDTWSITTPVLSAPLQCKPLLDDTTWSRGPNYVVSPGATVDIYPHFTTVTGGYSRAFQLTSTLLGNTRGVWVYLPPSYDENTDARFPVVYMHDGQNL
ncbi:MAG TPA: hypothetical protein VIF09_20020, partial [Polyangiaceae bacterium]